MADYPPPRCHPSCRNKLLPIIPLAHRLELPGEALQRLLEREARHGDARVGVPLVLRAELEAEDLVQAVGVRHLALGRLLGERRELGPDAAQAEPLTARREVLE